MEERELHAATRWEWEAILMRARLRGLIPAKGKRGGVSPATLRAVAFVLASHSDADTGTRIWPGDATVAVETEVGVQVVQAVRRALVEVGLLRKVRSRSRRERQGDEYQLTIPSDLMERLDVLSPAAVKVAAERVYAARRGKRGGSDGTPTPPQPDASEEVPSDPPQDEADDPRGESDGTPTEAHVGDPKQPPRAADDDRRGGSDGIPDSGCGGSDGAAVGDPSARDTRPGPTTRPTNPTTPGFSADVTTSRANDSVEDPDSVADGEPADAPPERCPDHPAMLAGHRESDGKPRCPFCRALSAPRPDYRAWDAERGRLAPVIPLHPAA
ncbi:hypothetical protein J2S43_007880 [Catenuloplanes nepalensis]|uniref:Helix-turn-helix domain-containing protein n=1 Tax=Catenuloplanes nepalensis TaxID=587533 RepID=A0ABT9N755_9ACTN|nr:hypothetical protein [Catenuloplanes nepalensis]MDP9799368.1 hypothetical protein [Catenuloplanes nepalensis]